MLPHRPLALHNPFGNVEVAVDVSYAVRWATSLVDMELHAAMGVTVAHTEERKILALVYKYCPHYKHV